MEHPNCMHFEAHVSGLVDDEGNLYTRQVEGHSCEYVEARNALIPFAEAKANKTAGLCAPKGGPEDERASWYAAWNQAFLAAMDRMWAARCASLEQQRVAA